MIKSFTPLNKKKKMTIDDCIKEFIQLESTLLDFYDYKKTITKMKEDEIKQKKYGNKKLSNEDSFTNGQSLEFDIFKS